MELRGRLGRVVSACPICKKPVADDGKDRPFCSSRCRSVDLGRWLGEEYRVSRPMSPEDEATLPRVSVADEDGEGTPPDVH